MELINFICYQVSTLKMSYVQNSLQQQCAKIGYFFLLSAIFSWRAIASQYYIQMSGFAGHIYSLLAIARQENIVSLKSINGYKTNRIPRKTCTHKYPGYLGGLYRLEIN